MPFLFLNSLSCVASGVPRGNVQVALRVVSRAAKCRTATASRAPPLSAPSHRASSPTPSSALPLRHLAYLASEVVRCAEMSSARDINLYVRYDRVYMI